MIVIVVVVVAAVLLTPVAIASAVTVPVSKITFSELTGKGSVKFGCCSNSTSSVTVYEYYFSTRPGGVVRTTDTQVNSTKGSTNVTISMILTTPASQTMNLGNLTVSGGVGNRTHTVWLSIDQGVRASGTYKLTVTLDASVVLAGSTTVSKTANGFETTWKVP